MNVATAAIIPMVCSSNFRFMLAILSPKCYVRFSNLLNLCYIRLLVVGFVRR